MANTCPDWCTITNAHPVERIHHGPLSAVHAPDHLIVSVGLVQRDRQSEVAGWVFGAPEVVVGPWRLPVAHAQALAARIDAAVRTAVEGEPKRRKLMPWDGRP